MNITIISSCPGLIAQCLIGFGLANSEATKKLAARSFFDMVKSEELIPSKDTEANFNKLFYLLKL